MRHAYICIRMAKVIKANCNSSELDWEATTTKKTVVDIYHDTTTLGNSLKFFLNAKYVAVTQIAILILGI